MSVFYQPRALVYRVVLYRVRPYMIPSSPDGPTDKEMFKNLQEMHFFCLKVLLSVFDRNSEHDRSRYEDQPHYSRLLALRQFFQLYRWYDYILRENNCKNICWRSGLKLFSSAICNIEVGKRDDLLLWLWFSGIETSRENAFHFKAWQSVERLGKVTWFSLYFVVECDPITWHRWPSWSPSMFHSCPERLLGNLMLVMKLFVAPVLTKAPRRFADFKRMFYRFFEHDDLMKVDTFEMLDLLAAFSVWTRKWHWRGSTGQTRQINFAQF